MYQILKKFGLPVVIAINHFVADTENEMQTLQNECQTIGVEAIPCYHWAKGGKGTTELAKKSCRTCRNSYKI